MYDLNDLKKSVPQIQYTHSHTHIQYTMKACAKMFLNYISRKTVPTYHFFSLKYSAFFLILDQKIKQPPLKEQLSQNI